MTAVRTTESSADAWATVRWPTPRSFEWASGLKHVSTVEAIIAIGSAARGCARVTSDVDLLVVTNGPHPPGSTPPEADVRWIPSAKLESRVTVGDDVVAWAVAFGLTLHDPLNSWRALRTDWGNRLPLPTRAACSARAARARHYAETLLDIGDNDAAAEQVLTMLTHEARLTLTSRGVMAASRPELVAQLREAGALGLSILLRRALEGQLDPREGLMFRGDAIVAA